MKLLQVQERINELMAQFVTEVKGATAMGRSDINRVSEVLLVPLFREVWGYQNLKNLNTEYGDNYPAIDLGDSSAGIAIQVTATPGLEKIKATLRKFVQHELYHDYTRLQLYILTERQNSYSSSTLADIIHGHFEFDPMKDILDYRDFLSAVSGMQIEQAERVLEILEKNISASRKSIIPPVSQIDNSVAEIVTLNLLEITFPDSLYIAEIDLDAAMEDEQHLHRDSGNRRRKRWKPKRELVRERLEKLGHKFAVDWEVYENKIITFHDLREQDIQLSHVIDHGTIEQIDSEEFYSADEGQEKTFKSLLRRCLQQYLFQRAVSWQNERHLFIFHDENGEDQRKEKWKGKAAAERVVFEKTWRQDEPEKLWYCKHLAFGVAFRQFSGAWYMMIRPDWFFSYDGYKESSLAPKKVTWLKQQENNQSVKTHLYFIVHFLQHLPSPTFLSSKPAHPSRFLSFEKLVTFDTAPKLPDKEWNPPETSGRTEDSDLQMALDL